jgi:hypothetical protein
MNATVPTDSILIKARFPDGAPSGLSNVRGWLGTIPTLANANLRPFWCGAQSLFYLYFNLSQTRDIAQDDLALLEDVFTLSFPEASEASASRLQRVFDVPGASLGEQAAFHYVVETDTEAGWMSEIANWYDTEHMPGLADVAGCVRASRFLNQDGGPLSFACYDLVSESTLGSPPWLAVRGSDWSSRVRPHFTNTLRTMFTVAASASADSL